MSAFHNLMKRYICNEIMSARIKICWHLHGGGLLVWQHRAVLMLSIVIYAACPAEININILAGAAINI